MLLCGLAGEGPELLQDEHVCCVAWQRRLEPIGRRDVAEALAETIRANGRSISDEALSWPLYTGGYAFMVQLVGYEPGGRSAEEGLSESMPAGPSRTLACGWRTRCCFPRYVRCVQRGRVPARWRRTTGRARRAR